MLILLMAPSPLRERVGVRVKAAGTVPASSPHPSPLPKGEGTDRGQIYYGIIFGDHLCFSLLMKGKAGEGE
jgi:hypothetical protein